MLLWENERRGRKSGFLNVLRLRRSWEYASGCRDTVEATAPKNGSNLDHVYSHCVVSSISFIADEGR